MKNVDIEKEPCSECGGKLEKRYISQDFEREVVTVKLAGIAAMVFSIAERYISRQAALKRSSRRQTPSLDLQLLRGSISTN